MAIGTESTEPLARVIKDEMSDDILQRLLKGPAYRIFFDESKGHLLAMQEFEERTDRTSSDQEFQQLKARAHTMKGGAGFFKFKAIQEICGKLEHLFERGYSVERAGECRNLISQLRSECQALPAPEKPE